MIFQVLKYDVFGDGTVGGRLSHRRSQGVSDIVIEILRRLATHCRRKFLTALFCTQPDSTPTGPIEILDQIEDVARQVALQAQVTGSISLREFDIRRQFNSFEGGQELEAFKRKVRKTYPDLDIEYAVLDECADVFYMIELGRYYAATGASSSSLAGGLEAVIEAASVFLLAPFSLDKWRPRTPA